MRYTLAAALVALVSATTATSAQTLSNTRTGVCHQGFCADVTRTTQSTPQAIFTTVRLTRWPISTHRNLRCANGQQVQGLTLRCAGREVSVQACAKRLIGRSQCGSWVVFR